MDFSILKARGTHGCAGGAVGGLLGGGGLVTDLVGGGGWVLAATGLGDL